MPMNTRHISAALLALLLTAPAMAEETKQAPAAAEAAAGPAQKAVKGKVLESMSGADYTYLLVEDGTEKIWAAIPESKVAVGQEVSLQPGMVMKDFESKALNKKFDAIVFSSGLAEEAGAAPAVEGGTPKLAGEAGKPVDEAALEALSGGSARAVVPAGEVKVEKAEGENGRTVEQCFAEAEKLNGQKIKVRGKVVKFTPDIMGKNWIHLQDGSGDPMKNTHDLVVTTSETAKKDEVVLVEGVLSKDKDFGAGYRYAAIIEDAKISK
ncbi:DNA-binding protein [Desulfobulbus sp. F4]|nr:DNA-binding protein [Desulfobulbus sp. F3]MCW5200989.1 DNA-binding protein [Desulfobulbus sp. F4]